MREQLVPIPHERLCEDVYSAMTRICGVFVLAVCGGLVGCGGGGGGDLPPDDQTRIITPAGGVHPYHDGALVLTVPPGAVNQNASVRAGKATIDALPLRPANLIHIPGSQYTLTPRNFALPVGVGVKFLPLDLPTGVTLESLKLCRAPRGGTWQETDNQSLDAAQAVLSGETSSFSDFTIFGSTTPPAYVLWWDTEADQLAGVSLANGAVTGLLSLSENQPVYIARPYSVSTNTGWVGVGPSLSGLGGGTFFAQYYLNGFIQQSNPLLAIPTSEVLVSATNDTDGTLVAITNTSAGTRIYRTQNQVLQLYASLDGIQADSAKTVPAGNAIMATGKELSTGKYVLVNASLAGGYTKVISGMAWAGGVVVSPDGATVTFAGTNDVSDGTEIVRCSFQGTNQVVLLDDGAANSEPRYLSDGSLVCRGFADSTWSLKQLPAGGDVWSTITTLGNEFRIVGDAAN